MTTYTPSISLFNGSSGPLNGINGILRFTLSSHGLSNGNYLYVSSGTITNVSARISGSNTNITVGNSSSEQYAAWIVTNATANTFILQLSGGGSEGLLVQQTGQTATNNTIVFKKATGKIQSTDRGGAGNYTNGDSIRFRLEGTTDNTYNGNNFVFYQSGLHNGFSGSNVDADLDNNPSTSRAGTFVATSGSPPNEIQAHYTLAGVTSDGSTSRIFEGGPGKLLLFVATASGGGGGGGSNGNFRIKGTGRWRVKGNGKLTIK